MFKEFTENGGVDCFVIKECYRNCNILNFFSYGSTSRYLRRSKYNVFISQIIHCCSNSEIIIKIV